MRWGIETVNDIAGLVSSFAIIIGLVSYLTSRNQFRFSVMVKCIERFQAILPELECLEEKADREREHVMRQYIDLCEEELFYFEKGFLPPEVRDEWIEGMLNYLPYIGSDGMVQNSQHKLRLDANCSLLYGYPRLRKYFGYPNSTKSQYEVRMLNLVEEIRDKLEGYTW